MKVLLILPAFMAFILFTEGTINICIPSSNSTELVTNVKEFKEMLSILDQDIIHIDHLPFDVHHPAINAVGSFDDLNVTNILNDFTICLMDLHLFEGYVDAFNLTFPMINLIGNYNLTGSIADLFAIWGTGPFYVNMTSFSIDAAMNLTTTERNGETCIPITVNVNLIEFVDHLYNFMDDPELEDLFSEVFHQLGPDAVSILWEEFKEANDSQIEEIINKIIHGGQFLKKMHRLKNPNLGALAICYTRDELNDLELI